MTTDDEYAERLRDVLRAEAEAVVPGGDGLSRIRERTTRRQTMSRWIRPLAFAGGAAVIAGGVIAGFALTGNDDSRLHENPAPPAASPTQPAPSSAPTSTPVSVPALPTLAAGLPLWPYADGATAAHGAVTTSPSVVALRFTTQHLGFTDDNLALGTTYSSDRKQSWVSIGYHSEGTRTSTAAVVHLSKWSNGVWEVVGTRDTMLSLTKPSYGAAASSPVTVGGKITGVDESIRVAVHQPSSDQPLGVACCTPAGGQSSSWSEKVSYKSSSASVLTVVASTGGHLTQHERWAITAIRNSHASASGSTPPSEFVAVSQGRIGVFRTSDGSRVRWLTTGTGASDPQVVGSDVYFLRDTGSCGSALMRVRFAGGPATTVTTPTGNRISGYAVMSTGRRAIVEVRCSDSTSRLLATAPEGTSHATPYSGMPPLIVGNPAWLPDGTRLAIIVRTGMQAHVSVVNPFTISDITSGPSACGDAQVGLPQAVAYSGPTLYAAVFDGGSTQVVQCSDGHAMQVFSTGLQNEADGFAADVHGNLLVGAPDQDTSKGEDIVVWTGQARTLQVAGLSQPSW